ncbi:MAG: hypothetical protein KA978_31985, partial [Deltaproteobacteria bacterium]|nr:hypothetical protein [Deltaproteobacteria bacterium]
GSSEAAMALTPIALIPQVVLGGLLVPMTNKSWLGALMAAMPARWSFEGVMSAERDTLEVPWRIQTCAPAGSNGVSVRNGVNVFNCAVEEIARTTERSGGFGFATWDRPVIHNGVLAGMLLLFLLLMGVLLRRRDSV